MYVDVLKLDECAYYESSKYNIEQSIAHTSHI